MAFASFAGTPHFCWFGTTRERHYPKWYRMQWYPTWLWWVYSMLRGGSSFPSSGLECQRSHYKINPIPIKRVPIDSFRGRDAFMTISWGNKCRVLECLWVTRRFYSNLKKGVLPLDNNPSMHSCEECSNNTSKNLPVPFQTRLNWTWKKVRLHTKKIIDQIWELSVSQYHQFTRSEAKIHSLV